MSALGITDVLDISRKKYERHEDKFKFEQPSAITFQYRDIHADRYWIITDVKDNPTVNLTRYLSEIVHKSYPLPASCRLVAGISGRASNILIKLSKAFCCAIMAAARLSAVAVVAGGSVFVHCHWVTCPEENEFSYPLFCRDNPALPL